MFQHSDTGFGGSAGGAAALMLDRPMPGLRPGPGRVLRARPRFAGLETLPDLGADIGSRGWWTGVAGCLALCASTLALAPGFHPLVEAEGTLIAPAAWEESRAQSIGPLAWGGDSGRHMGATDAVQPLTDTPERPQIDLSATLGQGDSLAHALERAGVSAAEARMVATMTSEIVDPDDIEAGTALSITLGRRPDRMAARPLQSLAFRARFEMKLAFNRTAAGLSMTRMPIAVDRTPLRIEGRVGDSLYLSARAAGAPAQAVVSYIRALAPKVPMEAIGRDDRFDLIVDQSRAATGEIRYGKLLYVGLEHGARTTRLIEWAPSATGGRSEWYDAAGVGKRHGGFVMPVSGAHKTSSFGMRFHPLLGYSRMHQGTDYGAAYGSPIRAVTDGTVQFAGWHGGHGNMVKLSHAGGLGTGYAHMSRIAVSPGMNVSQGQVIGFVGSTGLSTGPHLHFEVYRGGAAVNPGSVSFESMSLLSGAELAAFRARLNAIVSMRPAHSQLATR